MTQQRLDHSDSTASNPAAENVPMTPPLLGPEALHCSYEIVITGDMG